jgi:hypothetical protein
MVCFENHSETTVFIKFCVATCLRADREEVLNTTGLKSSSLLGLL